MFGARDFYFATALAVIALGVGLLFAQLYFSYFKLDRIFEILRNSHGAQIRKLLLGKDPISRIFLTNNIGMMIVHYKRSITNGELDALDYGKIPAKLIFYIRLMHFSALFVGIMMVLLFLIGKGTGWL